MRRNDAGANYGLLCCGCGPAPAAGVASGLYQAVDTALASGFTPNQIADMVAQRISPTHRVASAADIARLLAGHDAAGPVTPNSDGDDADAAAEVIYPPDAVPDGLSDRPSASARYGIASNTLWMWVKCGKLPHRGRVQAKSAGGGYILTDDAAIPHCRDNPKPMGRPRKVA